MKTSSSPQQEFSNGPKLVFGEKYSLCPCEELSRSNGSYFCVSSLDQRQLGIQDAHDPGRHVADETGFGTLPATRSSTEEPKDVF